MTVKELIKYLESLPEETKVFAVTDTVHQECDYEPLSEEIMRVPCIDGDAVLYIGLI